MGGAVSAARKPAHQTPDPGWCGDRSRGAGLGRPSDLDLDTTKTLTLRQVRLLGDYDEGGAYWGGGKDSQGLWVATEPESGEECYVRANSREQAMRKFPRAFFSEATIVDRLASFFPAYVEAALWASSWDGPDYDGEPGDGPGGVPLDSDFGPEDLSPECEAKMRGDCLRFLDACAQAIESASYFGRGDKWEQAGHDFWLTRSRGGCGFGDGDWSEPQDKILVEASRNFREPNLYVENGKVHHG